MPRRQTPETPPRWTEYVRLEDLPDDPRNPKGHDLAAIKSAIVRLGMIEQVTRDGRTGRLIAGHGRKTALLDLRAEGAAVPDGILVDDDGWLVAVTCGWSSKDDDEAALALVALNRAGELGGWRPEPLADLLADLASRQVSLDGSGYNGADLDLLLAGLAASSPDEPPAPGAAGGTNPEDEWEQMPDFEQEDRQSVAQIHVHFRTAEEAERFTREILGLASGKPPRSAWWPESDGHVGSDQKAAWVADAASA